METVDLLDGLEFGCEENGQMDGCEKNKRLERSILYRSHLQIAKSLPSVTSSN